MAEIQKLLSNIKVWLLFFFRNKVLRLFVLLLLLISIFLVYQSFDNIRDIDRFETIRNVILTFDQFVYLISFVYLFMLNYYIKKSGLSSLMMTKPFSFNKQCISVILAPVILAGFLNLLVTTFGCILFPILSIKFQTGFLFVRFINFIEIGIDMVFLGLLVFVFKAVYTFFIYIIIENNLILEIIKNGKNVDNNIYKVFYKFVDVFYFLLPTKRIFSKELSEMKLSFVLGDGDLKFILLKALYLIMLILLVYLMFDFFPNNLKRRVIR